MGLRYAAAARLAPREVRTRRYDAGSASKRAFVGTLIGSSASLLNGCRDTWWMSDVPQHGSRRTRVFAALLALAGVCSLTLTSPFDVPALAGGLGLVCSVAGMRGQGTVRWPLGLGALASAAVVVTVLSPAPEAGDADEFVGAFVWLGCSALMLVAGLIAVAWSLFAAPTQSTHS